MANVTIRPRRDTTANWELYNPILADKEMAFEVVATGSPVKMKIGDGYTAWTNLDYAVDFQAIETLATTATAQATIATTQATNAISIAKTYRQNSTAYAVNDIVLGATNLSKAYFLKCTTAGTTSSSTISTWSAVGSTTTDGTVVWTTKNVLDTTLAGHGITDAPTTSTMTTAIANSNPYCLALPHGAGLFNFSITNGTGVAWKLSNGVLSTSTTQNLTLPEGTSYLYCNNLWESGVQVSAGSTGSKFTGNLSVFSNLTNSLNLNNCSLVTGNLSSLSNLTYRISLDNCPLVTGNLSSLSNLTNYLSLVRDSLVTGNLSSLSNLTTTLVLSNCPLITGVLSPKATLSYIDISYTGVSLPTLTHLFQI